MDKNWGMMVMVMALQVVVVVPKCTYSYSHRCTDRRWYYNWQRLDI
jgi:hypothetical protein